MRVSGDVAARQVRAVLQVIGGGAVFAAAAPDRRHAVRNAAMVAVVPEPPDVADGRGSMKPPFLVNPGPCRMAAVHLVQLDIAWEDPAANRARVAGLLDRHPVARGDLVILPEMAFTGFSFDAGRTLPDAATNEAFLRDTAIRLGCTLVGGSAAPGRRTAANQALVFGPDGSLLVRYTKLQPFTLGGEAAAYEAGDSLALFDWAGLRVAPLICYDLRFPEHFRAAVKQGAEAFVVIANWPVRRIHHWLALLQARAIENLALVVGVNRCGTDPTSTYNGRSIVVSPHGHVVADAGEKQRVVAVAVDGEEIRQWRRDFPALADMR